jgi:hypothetical protein
MKRYIFVICITLSSVLLYTSCLGSDNNYEVTTYDDMAITGFSLSAVNRYIHTTSKSGNDSVYKATLKTMPTFTIDQNLYKIYNTDSVPKDCDLKHVLANISSSTYSGNIYIKSVASDTLYLYSNTDSIDFSQPRELRVYNNTLEKFRTYEVTINQHQVETGTILWEKMPAESYPVDTEKEKWEQIVAANADLKSFIGAGTKEAYAFSQDGRIMVTTDEGATWMADNIDDDLSLLPKEDIAFVSCPFNPNEETDYQLLAGIIEEGEVISVVWRKIAEYGEGSQASKWVYLPYEEYNRFYLPATPNLNLVYFHGYVLAIGTDTIRYSQDGGITWHTSDQFALPHGSEDLYFNTEAVTDSEGALWFKINESNEVWRGVLVEQ